MKELQGKSQNGLNGNQTTNGQAIKKCAACHGSCNGEQILFLVIRWMKTSEIGRSKAYAHAYLIFSFAFFECVRASHLNTGDATHAW